MKASGQFHDPAALPPRKYPPAPVREETGWAPESVWTVWSTEKSHASAGIRTPAVQPVGKDKINNIKMSNTTSPGKTSA
jgi:hypothetical protein